MNDRKDLLNLDAAYNLRRMLLESGGELTDEIELALATIGHSEDHVDFFIDRRNELKLAVEILAKRLEDLSKLRKGFDAAIERLDDGVKMWLDLKGLSRIEGSEQTVYFKNGPGQVVIEDESEIPEEFFKVRKEVSRQAIRQAIAEGDQVPGAKLMKSKHLMIKVGGMKPAKQVADAEAKPLLKEPDRE